MNLFHDDPAFGIGNGVHSDAIYNKKTSAGPNYIPKRGVRSHFGTRIAVPK